MSGTEPTKHHRHVHLDLSNVDNTNNAIHVEQPQSEPESDKEAGAEHPHHYQHLQRRRSSVLSGGDSNSSTADNRQTWSNRFEFFLACIGYSVGLGNVWRFGYLCAKSGGGAFLIPYFIFLLIVAVPLMYMEFAVGQFTQRGPIGALARLCPFFKGTGVATVVISFFLTTYYGVIICWDMFFLFSSFQREVPWKRCDKPWNTDTCWDGSLNDSLKAHADTRSPSEEFFRFRILKESTSMDDFGWPNWDLLLICVLAWIVIYFCIWKGVHSTGKVVYVTALFPYLVIGIFFVRGITLDGASIGLRYFLIPKWELLLDPSVWANAAIQNFNSIGIAFGGLISMASYNKRGTRIMPNVLAIALTDACTSIICGSMVFSVMGYIAKYQNKEMEHVVQSGPGLIFMVLPEAIKNMPVAPLWSILFFFMVFMLGIDSQFTMVETVITAIEDEFQVQVKRYLKKRELLVLFVCACTFLLSLPNICPGGIYYFTILDYYSAGISVFYIAFFEVCAVFWIYGARRLAKNITVMTGRKPPAFIMLCWYVLSPALIFGIWILNWIQYKPVKYGDYEYSPGVQIFGWCIALVSIMSIPLGAIHTVVKEKGGSIAEKLRNSFIARIQDVDPNNIDEVRMLKTMTNSENRAHHAKAMLMTGLNKIDPDVSITLKC